MTHAVLQVQVGIMLAVLYGLAIVVELSGGHCVPCSAFWKFLWSTDSAMAHVIVSARPRVLIPAWGLCESHEVPR